jgi:pyruvate carboxylase
VNLAFGDIVKVTPSSKVVGDMAIFLVTHDMTMQQFERLGPDHHLAIPNSVVEMFSGSLGTPEGGWPKALQRILLQGRKAERGRPGARLPAADLESTAQTIEKKIGRRPARDEVLSYLLYPEVFTKFVRAQQNWDDVEVLPSPEFFFGMQKGEEITVEIEPGKRLVVKFLTIGEPHPDGRRTVFFELNGQPREVTVRDRSLKAAAAERLKADASNPGHVGAPLPGMVTTVGVESNQQVTKGDRLLVLEAMKMQSTLYAPISGKVTAIHAGAGQQVEAKDLLIEIT